MLLRTTHFLPREPTERQFLFKSSRALARGLLLSPSSWRGVAGNSRMRARIAAAGTHLCVMNFPTAACTADLHIRRERRVL